MGRDEVCDIVVIGGGSAAFEAAVAARQAGAEKIVMLEKAPESEFGGNARYSHTGFRFAYDTPDEIREIVPDVDEDLFRTFHLPPYTRDDFLADLDRVTQGRIDPVLSGFMVDNSLDAVRWMRDVGIVFEPEQHPPINGKYYFEPGIIVHSVGGGLGQLLRWREIALGMGVDIRYDSRVVSLHGNDRRIEGVRVSSDDGEYDIHGRAVIACSGGFQANSEMRARYLGPNADLMKVRGSVYDTGEVLNMMLALGAGAAGHWQGAHATPIDAGASDGATPARADGHSNTANRYDYMFGITVNSAGRRFFDEGEANLSYTYAKTGRRVLAQPGSIAYQIFDQKGMRLFRLGPDYTDTYVEAPTIAELAPKIGLHPEVLAHTVESFNAAVSDDVPFDPSCLDGRSTAGIEPAKTNWATRIDEPPFRAYAVTCGVTFSFGGVRANTAMEVINTSGRAIQGLYASGDVVGLFFHNYPSCTGQTRNAVFSRVAGENAAARNY